MSTPAYKKQLTSDEKKKLASADKQLKSRLSMKRKPSKTNFSGDMNVALARKLGLAEVAKIRDALMDRHDALDAAINEKAANEFAVYIQEYKSITIGNDQSAVASRLPQHKSMNRYNNIQAYDASRVKVKPTALNKQSDYVNANWVHGYDRPNQYIASQGPTPDSFLAFWQMIWEQKVEVIVMVTNEVEGGKLKCHRYWPEAAGDPEAEDFDPAANVMVHGDITVNHDYQEVTPTYVERHFTVTSGGASRSLTQFTYTAWPDHGVPETTGEMIGFRATVKKHIKSEAPVMVHCSAGVGRTGTYIGLDRYLTSCADLGDRDTDVKEIVEDMRMARNYMVQAQAQYIYLHEACRDGLMMLAKKADREIQANEGSASAQAAQLAEIRAMELDLSQQTRDFRNIALAKGGIVPDVKHSLPSQSVKGELRVASRVAPEKRMQSLASSTQQWVNRRNVPMSPEEHGYAARTAPLELRLSALSDARSAWLVRYTEAERTWQAAQDMDGVYYDVGTELTPLESRVMSLAAAEEAWVLRSQSLRSLEEERVRNTVLELTARLQSLQSTVVDAERRWRDKGDGFRGTEQTSISPERPLPEVSTVDRLGGLNDRLVKLQASQTLWEGRGNWKKFDEDEFYTQINEEYEQQQAIEEAEMRAEAAALAEAKAAEEAAVRAKEQARRDKHAADVARAKKERERSHIKVSSMVQESYTPYMEMKKKEAAAAEKEKAQLDKQAEKDRAAEEKRLAKLMKNEQEKRAKSTAARFIGKLK